MTYPKAGVRIDTFRMDYELHGAPARTVGYNIIEPKPVVEVEVDPNETSLESFYYQILHDVLDFSIATTSSTRSFGPDDDWAILPHVKTMDVWEMWKYVGIAEFFSGEVLDGAEPDLVIGGVEIQRHDVLEVLVDRVIDILQGAGYFVSNSGSRFAVYRFDPYNPDGASEVIVISQQGDRWAVTGAASYGRTVYVPSFMAAVNFYAKNAETDNIWLDLFYENNGSYYVVNLFGDWTKVP